MDAFFASLRKLDVRRDTDNSWIGGVCSGVAARLNLDPLVVRAVLVLLGLFFGLGVTLYLVAWLLIPDPGHRTHLERALRSGDGGSLVLLVVAALAVLGVMPWWGGDFLGGGTWFGGFFVLIAVVALVLWGLSAAGQRRDDSGAHPGDDSAAHPGAGQPWQPGAWQSPHRDPTPGTAAPPAPAAPTPRPQSRRSGGFTAAFVATGLSLVTYGLLFWAGGEYDWSGNHHVIALAGVLGLLGLVVLLLGLAGRRSGFPGFLASTALVLSLVVGAAPADLGLSGRVGNDNWRPTTLGEDTPYAIGIGEARLDLGDLDPGELDGETVSTEVGVGKLTVTVPDTLNVRLLADVGVGAVTLEGQEAETEHAGGLNITEDEVVGEEPVDLVLDARVGIGQIVVEKEQ